MCVVCVVCVVCVCGVCVWCVLCVVCCVCVVCVVCARSDLCVYVLFLIFHSRSVHRVRLFFTIFQCGRLFDRMNCLTSFFSCVNMLLDSDLSLVSTF